MSNMQLPLHGAFTSYVWFIPPAGIISLNDINRLVNVTKTVGKKMKTQSCSFPSHEGTEGSGGRDPPILNLENIWQWADTSSERLYL
jgi:hypothetical protein